MKNVVLLLSLGLFGCTGGEVVSQNTSLITWDMDKKDELMAYAKIQIKTFESEGYTEVTNGETQSLVSSDKIRVWVNNAEADNYVLLKEGMQFPVGTTVIRVLYDGDSQPKKITASIKAASNQNPDASDWVFAVSEPNGVLMPDDTDGWQFGALEACNICHINQSATDGLFGLGAN